VLGPGENDVLATELLTDLRAAVGEQAVLTGDRLPNRSSVDVGEVRAKALVRPRTTAEVSNVLRLCHARGQAVVPHGGLTGLVYGASATENELILSLELMNRIEGVDVGGRTMRVEAGVTLQRTQEEAEKHDLMFAVDLGGRGSATIGGNISTNAGGVRVVRYGMMRAQVLGLEAVLADGTVLCSLNRALKNNTGYDLKQLFIGSEGTLGIVTRADLRLFPRPRSFNTAFVACKSFESVIKLLAHVDSHLAGQLGAFEVMWPEFYEVTTTPPARNTPPLPYGHAVYVLMESLGADAEADAARLEQTLGDALEQGLIDDAVIAKSEAERRGMWAIREDPWQTRRYGPCVDFDVSLPIVEMPAYVQETRRVLAERFPQTRPYVFGHIADGNLHIAVSAPDMPKIAEDVKRCVYEPLRPIRGAISAEHGIGLERKHFLDISRTPEEIAAMRAIKAALDPKRILNPGKIID
jgi:FAD/FMN-containing dehydrogenase